MTDTYVRQLHAPKYISPPPYRQGLFPGNPMHYQSHAESEGQLCYFCQNVQHKVCSQCRQPIPNHRYNVYDYENMNSGYSCTPESWIRNQYSYEKNKNQGICASHYGPGDVINSTPHGYSMRYNSLRKSSEVENRIFRQHHHTTDFLIASQLKHQPSAHVETAFNENFELTNSGVPSRRGTYLCRQDVSLNQFNSDNRYASLHELKQVQGPCSNGPRLSRSNTLPSSIGLEIPRRTRSVHCKNRQILDNDKDGAICWKPPGFKATGAVRIDLSRADETIQRHLNSAPELRSSCTKTVDKNTSVYPNSKHVVFTGVSEKDDTSGDSSEEIWVLRSDVCDPDRPLPPIPPSSSPRRCSFNHQ